MSERSVRVVHVLPSLSPQWGGPVSVIENLTIALADLGVKTTVLASSGPTVGTDPIHVESASIRLFQTSFGAHLWPAYGPGWSAGLVSAAKDADVLHIHELWHYPHFRAYRVASVLGKPYVVTPHGELGTRHFRQKLWKKWPYFLLVQRGILQKAQVLHAMSVEESNQIRAHVTHDDIRIIPNGTAIPELNLLSFRNEFDKIYGLMHETVVILYMGRLHRMKGLDILVRAYQKVSEMFKEAVLVVAGPDSNGYRRELEEMVHLTGLRDRVIFTGMVTGRDKSMALAAADLFVLPSYAEGFSMAVLEALACGLPVIISDQCNFPRVAEEEAGLVVPATEEAVTSAMTYLIARPEVRRRMGASGRKLVEREYTWNRIGTQMLRLYQDAIQAHTRDKV